MDLLEPRRLLRDAVLEIRGDGKAGGGLILAFESLAALLLEEPELFVQEWPFFSSARRGANIRSFLRVSARPVTAACEVSRPAVALLMNESAARSMDFAEGVPSGGTYVINTRRSPGECAAHFRLSGRVFTVPGDEIGLEYLKYSIGNVSAYVALAHAIGGLVPSRITRSFVEVLRKRRIPEALVRRNQDALEASSGAIRSGVFDLARPGDHVAARFAGYGALPVGAQSPLRLSQGNRTADYAPSGFRLRFQDSKDACTGCAHCVTNCPEGIIRFVPHPELGLKVTGVDVGTYCKLCRECIAICPERLFEEVPFEEVWETSEPEPVGR